MDSSDAREPEPRFMRSGWLPFIGASLSIGLELKSVIRSQQGYAIGKPA